jgi:IclR family acetate operon transcriptional repressor
LFKQLQMIRQQGYAIDDEEARIGLRCVAAVVYNNCGEPLAAISVSGLTSRLTDDRLPALGRIVHEVAAELTVVLGGVVPAADDRS